jgi:hypothetical protein
LAITAGVLVTSGASAGAEEIPLPVDVSGFAQNMSVEGTVGQAVDELAKLVGDLLPV